MSTSENQHNLSNDYDNLSQNQAENSKTSNFLLAQISQKLENLENKIGKSDNSVNNSQNKAQPIQIKGLDGFLWTYILFGLPSFVASILGVLILFGILLGVSSTSKQLENSIASSDSMETRTENLKIIQKIGNPSSSDGILVYNMQGAIATGGKGQSFDNIQNGIWTDLVSKDFETIKQNKDIKNVVFRMDTPGGEVFASEIIGDLIGDLLKAKGQQQVVFYFDQVVASGGLWATYKNPNYVVASPYGETGSIGVRTSLANFQKLADNIGYKELVIKSGANKDYGNPLREPLPEEVSFIQKQVDETYQKFIQTVATGRKLEPNKVKEFANGFVYSNSVAKSFGLIDELAGIEKSYQKAAENAKLSNYNIWEMQTPANPLREILGGLGAKSNLEQLSEKIEAKITLKSGIIYAIDETRLN